jgi:hypothetical protein
MNKQKETLAQFFRDWMNNYLTYEKMASDYQMTPDEVKQMINLGRKYHNEQAEGLK